MVFGFTESRRASRLESTRRSLSRTFAGGNPDQGAIRLERIRAISHAIEDGLRLYRVEEGVEIGIHQEIAFPHVCRRQSRSRRHPSRTNTRHKPRNRRWSSALPSRGGRRDWNPPGDRFPARLPAAIQIKAPSVSNEYAP